MPIPGEKILFIMLFMQALSAGPGRGSLHCGTGFYSCAFRVWPVIPLLSGPSR
jgi:hypothetical protein